MLIPILFAPLLLLVALLVCWVVVVPVMRLDDRLRKRRSKDHLSED